MLGLIGRKLGMTRVFDDKGAAIPVTVVEAGPCTVVRVKRPETDGYSALQLGFGRRKETRVAKPLKGHFAKVGLPPTRLLREVRVADPGDFEPGAVLRADIFKPGERVDVRGVSKGRGFEGPITRHHSSRGPETHGSNYHRRPGSMGASSDPSRVWKGKAAAGHMGAERVTTRNLPVVGVDADRNLLLLGGAVPGHNKGWVLVTKSKRARRGSPAA